MSGRAARASRQGKALRRLAEHRRLMEAIESAWRSLYHGLGREVRIDPVTLSVYRGPIQYEEAAAYDAALTEAFGLTAARRTPSPDAPET